MKDSKCFIAKVRLIMGLALIVLSVVSSIFRTKSLAKEYKLAKRNACMKNHPSGKGKKY